MDIRSEITKSYRILHLLGALVWLFSALMAGAILYMLLRTEPKTGRDLILMAVLLVLAVLLFVNALSLFSQNFKSIEISADRKTVTLHSLGKSLTLQSDEISKVSEEERYLLYSFTTKPRKMLRIEAGGAVWSVRSDILTSYDRLINFFQETVT